MLTEAFMKIFSFKSFRAQLLVLLIAVSVTPFLVMSITNYHLTQEVLRKNAYEALTATGEMRAKIMAEVIRGNLDLVDGLAARSIFKTVADPGSSRDAIQAALEEMQKKYNYFYEVFIVDGQGRTIGSSDKARIGTDRSSFSYFTDAMKGKASFADVYKSSVTGHAGYSVAAPIYDLSGEKIVGALVALVDIDQLNQVTTDVVGLGKTGECYLVNEKGYMITASRFKGNEVVLTQKVDTEGVRRARSGEDVTGIFYDYRGQKVLGHYDVDEELAKATGEKWCVITEIDEKEAFEAARQLGGLMVVIGVFCVALIFVLGLFYSGRFSKPINILAEAARKVSEGDLGQKIEIARDDEIGVLAKSFTVMVANLRELLKKIQESTNHITSASNEILAATQEQASAAREQSSAVAETTSAAKELSATSEQVGESIKKVAQVAAHALAGMAKIKDTIDKTNGMLASLGEKSQKIGKITEMIDDVADQTNLLAVNASIEAARAGEQGRGFTVVADEIRKLADSTAKSTKDITSLIELIQHEMSNAIMSMETSVSSVDEEARLAQQTTEKTKEIAMSTHQQISGSKQIADAMMSIDEAMKQIAAGAAQSQASVKQLNELAGEMKQLTSKFKL
jgi:methyl-accepting chemotaxis protein